MPPPDPAAGSDAARAALHTRGARVVRRSRILAQSGVPLLLLCAVLVVVAYNSGPASPPLGPDGDAGATLTHDAEDAARAQLEELEAWAALHPDEAVRLYERARALSGSRVAEVSAAAARLCERALARVDPELREVLGRGERLEAEGRDWEADQHYKAFLGRPGITQEAARVVREARGRAVGRLQRRFAADAARVRELLTSGAHGEAVTLVTEVGRYAGPEAEQGLRALLASAATAAASPGGDVVRPAEHAPIDVALLSQALRGRVEDAGDGAVRVRYAFESELELEDWPAATQSFSGPLLPSHLEPLEPVGHPGWYVADGKLVGDGWTRRQLAIDFRADRPVCVELTARGARNRVASLGLLPGRSFLGGSGWALDLPLERVPRRTTALEALVLRCRERGPAVALVREARFLELSELHVDPEQPRAEARVTLELRPDGGRHLLALTVDDLQLEPLAVDLDAGPVRAFLVALGSPLVVDDVVVTGVPSPDIAAALPGLAAAAPEGLGRALRRWLGRRRPAVTIR